jgi:UV DNA damage endonuclease
MIRLGLCCIFRKQPIKFRRTTAKHLKKFSRTKQLDLISLVCAQNAGSLLKALQYCRNKGIKDFRVNSQILPLKTHPDVGYRIEELPDHRKIVAAFKACGKFCRENDIRTTFHPDQFILLSSPKAEINIRSKADLLYQAQVAEWINADVINIHGGGAYGDKKSALMRLSKQIEKLPASIRSRLTLENDDRVYTPKDLLPVCRSLAIPLVYDVHHHRCLTDGVGIKKTTDRVLETWNREPLFHLSSPLNGWNRKDVHKHHDYVQLRDLPTCWLPLDITIEVEAKAKELAVLKLQREIKQTVIYILRAKL